MSGGAAPIVRVGTKIGGSQIGLLGPPTASPGAAIAPRLRNQSIFFQCERRMTETVMTGLFSLRVHARRFPKRHGDNASRFARQCIARPARIDLPHDPLGLADRQARNRRPLFCATTRTRSQKGNPAKNFAKRLKKFLSKVREAEAIPDRFRRQILGWNDCFAVLHLL